MNGVLALSYISVLVQQWGLYVFSSIKVSKVSSLIEFLDYVYLYLSMGFVCLVLVLKIRFLSKVLIIVFSSRSDKVIHSGSNSSTTTYHMPKRDLLILRRFSARISSVPAGSSLEFCTVLIIKYTNINLQDI